MNSYPSLSFLDELIDTNILPIQIRHIEQEYLTNGGLQSCAEEIQYLPKYDDYKNLIQDAVKKLYGFEFTAYTGLFEEDFEHWRNNGESHHHYLSVFLNREDPTLDTPADICVKLPVPIKAIIMRGEPGSTELIIDAQRVSSHLIEKVT